MRHFSCLCVFVLSLNFGCSATQHDTTLQQASKTLPLEIAQIYIKKGALEAAIPLLRRTLVNDPNNVEAHILYATVFRDLGLYPQAEKHFLQILQRHPENPKVCAGIAILYDLQRKPDQALFYHRKSITYQPQRADYHNNLGFSLYLSGKIDDAIRELEMALALDPSLSIAYNNLGFAYGKRNEMDKAKRMFRTVNSEIDTLKNLALIYQYKNKSNQAEQLRKQSQQLKNKL